MVPVLSDAIVVRVVDYGEADRVATMLTRQWGKVSALARGARRSRKRFGALELFARGEARLREGRGDLWMFEGFDVARGFPHLGLDVGRVAHAAYACEIARELSPPHHPEPRLFDLLSQLLAIVDGAPSLHALGTAHLRVFELSVLDTLGFSPALDRCVGCDRLLDEDEGEGEGGDLLDVRRGGVLCGRCVEHGPGRRPLPARVRRLLCRAQRARLDDPVSLSSLASPVSPVSPAAGGEPSDVSRSRDAWDGARDAILAVLAEHLPRPLRSVEFIHKLNAARA